MEFLHFYITEGTASLTPTYDERYATLQYSYNKTDWTTVTNDTSISFVPDKKVYFKGVISGYVETEASGSKPIINFKTTGSPIYAGGSIMSLQNGNPDETTIKYRWEFSNLFRNCKTLVTAPVLPATTLSNYCYYGMFEGCSSLVKAPELSATKLEVGCYRSMFDHCISFTDAPALPATTLEIQCYMYMFKGCKFTTSPVLPATTLASECYFSMFENCEYLVNPPELPATTLASACYEGMFKGCFNLKTAPALPATTLADYCYCSMFEYCRNLINTPDLPVTTLEHSCYMNMFEGCKSLVNAPALPATTLAYDCYRSMFRDCTNLVKAPDLPSETLAEGCYYYMFYGCTSITNAPDLLATTPVTNCYTYMFNRCSNLNYVKCLLKTDTNEYTTDWLNGVSATGTFVKNNEANNWERSGNGIPVGWNVENYTPTVITYTLTVRGNNSRLTNGSSTNIGDATFDVSAVYTAGTSVTIGCKPKSGYRFVQWNDGNTNSERTVVVNSDITYTATVVKTYRIIAQDESVHHCNVRGTGVYDENSVAELTVVPFEGYMFSHWEDNSTDLPRYITVTEDKTVWAEAVLAPPEYTITLQGDNCTLNGGGTYYEGTTVEISCVPNTGYYFVRWRDGNTNATRTITVTEDITLTAVTRAITSNILEIKARKGSGEYERNNIIWYLDYKGGTFLWDARVYTDFDNLTTNVEISDNRVTNISKGSSWIGDSRIYSFNMTVPRNDSDTNKEFTINISSTNIILSDSITIRVIQKPKLPVLIEDIFVSSGDVENALVTIPDNMEEVLVVYEDETLAKYTIDDCVSNYVLYYRNALGGIDLFPVTGKVIKSNDIEHLTINKKYDNRTLNFGKTNYENVLTEKWQLYSGRLTDQQSKLMHHLINSTYVYLYDIQADKFTPVVITDTEMEYKTYKNNNNKMVYYTINVEASQTKYRR